MNRKFLLTLFTGFVCFGAVAQKEKRTLAYAITGVEKGSQRWTEVRQIDVHTGQEVKTIYENAKEFPVLNARTGKPIEKKTEINAEAPARTEYRINNGTDGKQVIIIKRSNNETLTIVRNNNDENNTNTTVRRSIVCLRNDVKSDKPFATNSAAC